METKTFLREWAIENKVWEPKAWRVFIEKDLVPFYKYTFTLNALYEFFKSEKICGKSSLADIEDETLRSKIRVAIYGGVGSNQGSTNSFAKFMHNNFGICAENAPSFEESIEHYESWGDGVRVGVVSKNTWINSIPIGNLIDQLKDVLLDFPKKLGIKLSDIGIQESYPYLPLETVEPDTLLPQPGEKPEKIISLLNNFKQKTLDLSIGVNPFTTFVFYSRTTPLSVLMEFLGCDMDKVTNLADFLQLKAYSMIDQKEVSLPTKSPDKVILLPKDGTLIPSTRKIVSESSTEKILILQSSLRRVIPTVNEIYENMIKEALSRIHIIFEPWKDYEPILSFLNDAPTDNQVALNLDVKNGIIVKIESYSKKIELSNRIWLRDFLMKVSPLVSVGIAQFPRILIRSSYYTNPEFSYDIKQLKFHPFAREWFKKVINNGGKT